MDPKKMNPKQKKAQEAMAKSDKEYAHAMDQFKLEKWFKSDKMKPKKPQVKLVKTTYYENYK